MNRWTRIFAAALAAVTALGAAPPAEEPVTLIRGARVFEDADEVRVRDVLIRGQTIARIGRDLDLPAGATLVDGAGMTLIPGLHDLHIHTRRQAFESPQALQQGYAPYLAHGVTTVNEYSVSGEMIGPIRAMAEVPTPHLNLAIRFGVPHGHGTESQFTNSITTQVTTPGEAEAAMSHALTYRPDVIKVFTDGWRYGRDADRPNMDLPTLSAIVKAAHRAHVPVVTHTVTLEGAKTAARARVDAIVHGIGDALVDKEVIRLMKGNGTAYVPTLVVYEPQQDRAFRMQEWSRLAPADRAREEARLARPAQPIPEYESRRWWIMRENVRLLKAAGVRIGVGTDTGIGGVYQGSAALREIGWLTRLGFTPGEAIAAATSVSARIMGEQRSHGRIARGRRADLVLIAGRPDERIEDLHEVRRVWVSGREVFAP